MSDYLPASNVSSVSPERCEMTYRRPAARQSAMVWMVSLTVPIWLSLMSTALVVFSAMPRRTRLDW